MDHLSKIHLNRTVNELGNIVLWKPHRPNKRSRQTNRLAAQQKYNKDLTPGGRQPSPGSPYCAKNSVSALAFASPSRSTLAARWFIAKTQKWVQLSCIVCRVFKATRRFLENFQKLENNARKWMKKAPT